MNPKVDEYIGSLPKWQDELEKLSEILLSCQLTEEYIFEAIEVENAGLKVEFKKNNELFITEEFQIKLDTIPELKTAFFNLTPGRQREYGRYFSEPKQAKTRESRVNKYISQILSGKGLNDKYII